MMISVIYKNDKHGLIESYQLDDLIRSGKIKKFLRSDGWVTIGKDRLRATEDCFKGHEKRQSNRKKQ
jgi:hypothetical protein